MHLSLFFTTHTHTHRYFTPIGGWNVSAEFCNMSLVEASPPPLRAVLRSPSYRGRVTSEGPSTLEVRAWINLAAAPLIEAAVYPASESANHTAKDGSTSTASTEESDTHHHMHATPLVIKSVAWPPTDGSPVDLVFAEDPRKLLTTPGDYEIMVCRHL